MLGYLVSINTYSLFYSLPDLNYIWYYIWYLVVFSESISKYIIIILYFFDLQIICSITILFLEWILLNSFSSCDNSSWSIFFLYGSADSCLGKIFFYTRVSQINYINHLFRSDRVVLFCRYHSLVFFLSYWLLCEW